MTLGTVLFMQGCTSASAESLIPAPRFAIVFDSGRALDLRRNSRATGGHPSVPTDTMYVNQSESVEGLGAFADVNWPATAKLLFSGGTRWDQTNFTAIDHFFGDGQDNSGSRNMIATTGHLGGSYVFSNTFTTYVTWSTAFETPMDRAAS